MVRHLDVSPDDVRMAVRGSYDLAQIVHVPVGAVVGRRLDNLTWRSEPSEL